MSIRHSQISAPTKPINHKWVAIPFDAHKAKVYRFINNWSDNCLRRLMPASAIGGPYIVREIK